MVTKPIAWYICAIYTFRPHQADGKEIPDMIDEFNDALAGFRAGDIEVAFIEWLCKSQDFPEPDDILWLLKHHGFERVN